MIEFFRALSGAFHRRIVFLRRLFLGLRFFVQFFLLDIFFCLAGQNAFASQNANRPISIQIGLDLAGHDIAHAGLHVEIERFVMVGAGDFL